MCVYFFNVIYFFEQVVLQHSKKANHLQTRHLPFFISIGANVTILQAAGVFLFWSGLILMRQIDLRAQVASGESETISRHFRGRRYSLPSLLTYSTSIYSDPLRGL